MTSLCMDPKYSVVSDAVNLIKCELKDQYPEREIRVFVNLILEHLANLSPTDILLRPDAKLPISQFNQIVDIIKELKEEKPLQYILGKTLFYGLVFKLNPDVLIPRQETEELVKWIIDDNIGNRLKILDIGTGSGCIAVALAVNMPYTAVTATDISPGAVKVASGNAALNKVKIRLIEEDLFNPVIVKSEKYDIIVSNPPYVTGADRRMMQNNVLLYEPANALFVSDSDPLIYYRQIASLAGEVLNPGGKIYFEINENRYHDIEKLLKEHHFSNITIRKDINGRYRMARALL